MLNTDVVYFHLETIKFRTCFHMETIQFRTNECITLLGPILSFFIFLGRPILIFYTSANEMLRITSQLCDVSLLTEGVRGQQPHNYQPSIDIFN